VVRPAMLPGARTPPPRPAHRRRSAPTRYRGLIERSLTTLPGTSTSRPTPRVRWLLTSGCRIRS
jgi:hypothetical protein